MSARTQRQFGNSVRAIFLKSSVPRREIIGHRYLKRLHQLPSAVFECRKVIGSVLLRYTIGLKDSRLFFIQSDVKPKPIAPRSHTFSLALRQPNVFNLSLNWFNGFSMLYHFVEISSSLSFLLTKAK